MNNGTRLPLAERFWPKVSFGPGCWEWQGARHVKAGGYGTFGLDRRTMVRAHRMSYELAVGPIPAGMLVLHRCDNPPCVRPSHLFLGTPKDNTADMDRKGRRRVGSRPGELNHHAKLTESQVVEIRRRYEAGEQAQALAVEFGVSSPLISYIGKRKAWRHVA